MIRPALDVSSMSGRACALLVKILSAGVPARHASGATAS